MSRAFDGSIPGTYLRSASKVSMRFVPAAASSSGRRVPLVRCVTIHVERKRADDSFGWVHASGTWTATRMLSLNFYGCRYIPRSTDAATSPVSG